VTAAGRFSLDYGRGAGKIILVEEAAAMFEIYLKYRDKKDTAPEKVRRYVEVVDEAIKALSKSSPRTSRVFELKMRGISASAISKVLGISPRQVTDYLAEANTFLKDHISKSTQLPDQNL
jgi:hypothetical protein